MSLYIQYGCGLSAPAGWQNYDASPRLRLERLPFARTLLGKQRLFPETVVFGDIVRGLSVKPGSADGIYCSHVLEHIPRGEVITALRNTLSMLRPGGIFRLVVPDLSWRIEAYRSAAGTPDAADDLQDRLLLRHRERGSGLVARFREIMGNSMHQWMYDEASLTALLGSEGFVDIRRCTIGDCADPAFTAVEEYGRFFADDQPELAIEARKSERDPR